MEKEIESQKNIAISPPKKPKQFVWIKLNCDFCKINIHFFIIFLITI